MSDFKIDFSKEYGIYSKIIQCKDDLYVAASLDPIADNISPMDIIRRNERNTRLFYPVTFAVKIDKTDNLMRDMGKFLQYCREAEFVKAIYNEFGLPIPERLRYSELYSLMRFNDGRMKPETDTRLVRLYEKGLQKFFRNERRRGLRKKWRDFFRSDKFDDDASKLKNLLAFFKRKSPETDIDILLKSGESVKWIAMQEHEYSEFRKTIKEYYSDIFFSVGKKYIVNHGMVEIPGNGKTITFKDFCEIRNKSFSTEGYRALENLNISYWNFRDVFFKSADEPVIAQIYNNISLKFAKCVNLQDLFDKGDISYINIPIADFMDFTSLAQENNLPFYIDKWGEFQTPNLDTVCVVYNKCNDGAIGEINRVILDNKIHSSHAISVPQKEMLNAQISNASAKKQTRCCQSEYIPHEKIV
ncbi:MAG: hypothetical protein J1F01_00710 [Oscillospiraceae bacterium]|nr:hypothetical protein [Oscillospiraceae bacterium]